MPHVMRNGNMHVKNEYAPRRFARDAILAHTGVMNISNLRRMRGLNQVELAEMVGITQGALSRAENGEDSVTLRNYKAIAQALNVPLADLFEDDRTKAENEVMELFRRLPRDRQAVWIEMCRAFSRGQQEPTARSL